MAQQERAAEESEETENEKASGCAEHEAVGSGTGRAEDLRRRGGGRGYGAGLYKERRAGAADDDGGGAARPAGGCLPGRPRGVRGARGGDCVRRPLARRTQHATHL